MVVLLNIGLSWHKSSPSTELPHHHKLAQLVVMNMLSVPGTEHSGSVNLPT